MPMTPLSYTQLDCQTFPEALGGRVAFRALEDLTGKVPHVEGGGAGKYSFSPPWTKSPIYVLTRNGFYTPDAGANEVWQFAQDFDAPEAAAFLEKVDQDGRPENY